MKMKRIDKGKGKKKDTVSAFNDENDTLVVQRLSTEVSGKAQNIQELVRGSLCPMSMKSLRLKTFEEHVKNTSQSTSQ